MRKFLYIAIALCSACVGSGLIHTADRAMFVNCPPGYGKICSVHGAREKCECFRR